MLQGQENSRSPARSAALWVMEERDDDDPQLRKMEIMMRRLPKDVATNDDIKDLKTQCRDTSKGQGLRTEGTTSARS